MFLKRFGAMVVSVSILFLLVSGCRFADLAGRYYNIEHWFSIRFPADWEKKEGFWGTTVVALSPIEGDADTFRENINVVVEPLPENMGLEKYYQLNMESMPQILTGFQIHEEGETMIDKRNVRWVVYTHEVGTGAETTAIKVIAYIAVKNNRGYTITSSADPQKFPEWRGKFEEIVQTFRF